MTGQLKIRDDDGKYVSATAHDRAMCAFQVVMDDAGYHTEDSGWIWLRDKLARFCLKTAQNNSYHFARADKWIRRYQAIRGIE